MGEARRRKQAGYLPEPKIVKSQARQKVVKHGVSGIGTMAMVAALLAEYPKLPRRF